MTPIQELLKESEFSLFSEFSRQWIEKEKEFAKQCFEVGMNYESDDSGMMYEPNFEQFYKQISENK